MIQFIPLVIVPQIFFSGLFPIESMNKWLQMLGELFPLTYGADAMRQVMIRNQGFTEIALDLTVLLLFSFICSRKCIGIKETSQNIMMKKGVI